MKYEDLEEFFELYVENYCAYKDDKLYKSIIKFLHSYYLKHTYEEIPGTFKTAFEKQTIPLEFYDALLLSNGFPKSLLETLTFGDKYILLNSLMDYQQYKGTLKCLRKTVSVFNDNFNVYELFLDYRDTSSDGKGEYDWVFTPYPVYIDESLKDEVIDDFFNFEEIFEKAEHFFVNKDQLNELKDSNDLLLPIKTNLIMIDQTVINNVSPLMSLFFLIVLKTFRNERMVLYFEDGQYSITLERAYRLWYYILFKWYGKDVNFTAPAMSIIYALDNPIPIPYDLHDIDVVLNEYNNLSYTDVDSGEKVRLFYKEKIEDIFKQIQVTPINFTQEEWTSDFKENLGRDLIEYIDGRLANFEAGSDITREASKLLDEVYNSLITWSVTSGDEDINNYIHYFLDLLPLLMVQPEKTPTFRVLNFLKPFHVELAGQGRNIIRVNDKFNAIYTDEKWNFVIKLPRATLNNSSHKFLLENSIPIKDNFHVLQDAYFLTSIYMKSYNEILDEFSTVTSKPSSSLISISEKEKFNLFSELVDNLHIISRIPKYVDSRDPYLFDIEDLYVYETVLPKPTIENITEKYIYSFYKTPDIDSMHILGEIPIFRELFWRYFGEIDYTYRFDSIYIGNTAEEIINNYNFLIEKNPDYDDFVIDLIIWFRERFFKPFEIYYSYNFNDVYIGNTLEDIIDNYNYIINIPSITDYIIDLYIWFRERFFHPFEAIYLYEFTNSYIGNTVEEIVNNYNSIIKNQAFDDIDIDVYAWFRERFFHPFNIDYLDYKFLNSKYNTVFNLYNYIESVIKLYNQSSDMNIDDYFITGHRSYIDIENLYDYEFNLNSKIDTVFMIQYFLPFTQLSNYNHTYSIMTDNSCNHREYDNFNVDTTTWDYIYHPVIAVEDFYTIDFDYRFKTIKDKEELMEISHDFNTFTI